jgi:hypothetical protein
MRCPRPHGEFGPMLSGKRGAFVAPECAWLHGELKRQRHLTLQPGLIGS